MKKIPTFIAFFKLLLGHVKVELILILWYFFGAFFGCAPTRPLIDTLVFQ